MRLSFGTAVADLTLVFIVISSVHLGHTTALPSSRFPAALHNILHLI
jgi:hypothetical protein